MKIQLLSTGGAYTKTVPLKKKNAAGDSVEVRDAEGNLVMTKRNVFRYAITEATEEELELYKQRQSEYYREEVQSGKPLFYSVDFLGNSAEVSVVENEDGTVAVLADRTDIVKLKSIYEEIGHIGDNSKLIGQMLLETMLGGKEFDVSKYRKKVAGAEIEEEDEERQIINASNPAPAEKEEEEKLD